MLPPDFDWVKARHECSASNVFELLKLETRRNVVARNAALGKDVFQVSDNGGPFSVFRRAFEGTVGVRFALDEDRIVIAGNGVPVNLSASLTVNDEGECRLVVNGEQLDRWQVLKRALEPLLFGRLDY